VAVAPLWRTELLRKCFSAFLADSPYYMREAKMEILFAGYIIFRNRGRRG